MFEVLILLYFGSAMKLLARYCYYQVTKYTFKPGISFSLGLDGVRVRLSLTTTSSPASYKVTLSIPISTIFTILGWLYSSGGT